MAENGSETVNLPPLLAGGGLCHEKGRVRLGVEAGLVKPGEHRRVTPADFDWAKLVDYMGVKVPRVMTACRKEESRCVV